MSRASIVLSLLLAAFLCGCVQSVHPYYTEAQLTYDPLLAGKWSSDEDKEIIAITGDADAKLYHVLYTDKEGKTGKFEMHLAKVQEQLLADITPEDMFRDDESDMHKVQLLPVHSFLLVERKGDDALEIRAMSHDWLKEYLDKNPVWLRLPAGRAHERLNAPA